MCSDVALNLIRDYAGALLREPGASRHIAMLNKLIDYIATLEADAARLEWCERHMQEASVFDPPSGDAWVWELRYVLPGDADDLTTRSTQGHAYFRAAIDDAMTDAAEVAA